MSSIPALSSLDHASGTNREILWQVWLVPVDLNAVTGLGSVPGLAG